VSREDGTSLITTTVRDQAMLLGLLIRIRDLGIPLLGLYPASENDLRPPAHAVTQEETP
jgi:hypothetical protein